MELIPLSAVPWQRLQVVLDDQSCTIALRWMQCRLYLDLWVGSTPICRGAICQNRAEIVQSPTPDFSGELHFYDQEGDESPVWSGLHDGSSGRWGLLYLSEDEEVPEELRH